MMPHTFEVTTDNFTAEVIDSPLPVLVEFGADWCPPCKMIAPFVEAIARQYDGQLRVGEVDGDAHPELIMRYGVMGLPTLILFQNGVEVERIIGFKPRAQIEAKILPYLSGTDS